jgi:hypothetical protein
MKITVEPSPTTTEIDGVPVRLWLGHTDSGVPVTLAVYRVMVEDRDAREEFARELTTCLEPLERPTELEALIEVAWGRVVPRG